jgi:SAM-dependent methyltransferase
MDDPIRDRNRVAWNAGRYAAWVEAIGTPEAEARALVADPRHKVRRLAPYLGDVAGLRIVNVQGSHGRVAVALALLGAEASVIDFAEENRRYALELAAAAGVAIDYVLADSIEADRLGLAPFDWVVMELGILHYHRDLARFFAVIAALAAPGGRLLLHEFHPVDRKLARAPAGLAPDYFRTDLVEGEVPNPVGDGRTLGTCAYRLWTLGEIVTAAIDAGWRIDRLDEHPGWPGEPGWPGTFTLVATRG